MRISLITAMGKDNRVIGKDNNLPWRFPADLKKFKSLTEGHTIVMGRKTVETLPPLPGRHIIVLTRSGVCDLGQSFATSPESAIEAAKEAGETELFIGGGAEVYKAFIPFISRIYLTEVDYSGEGDTVFPEIDWAEWHRTYSEKLSPTEKHPMTGTFTILTK